MPQIQALSFEQLIGAAAVILIMIGIYNTVMGAVDTDETRSAWFEALVLKGYKAEPDEPPDACPIDGDCEMPDITGALGLLADYLKTAEFAANFEKYIKEAFKK